MWRWWKEFPHALHSQAGSHAGCPQEEQEDHVLQVNSAQHWEQVEGGNLGIQDSRADSTACAYTIHMCKQMGLDTNFAEAEQTVIKAELEVESAKMEYVKVCNSKKKKNKGNKPKGNKNAMICLNFCMILSP